MRVSRWSLLDGSVESRGWCLLRLSLESGALSLVSPVSPVLRLSLERLPVETATVVMTVVEAAIVATAAVETGDCCDVCG